MASKPVSKKFDITIPKFKQFNPRSDVKKSSWFRLEHSLFFGPEFHDFSCEELMVWIYLLSVASYKNSDTATHEARVISSQARVTIGSVASALEKLEENQCITVRDTCTLRTRYVEDTSTGPTYERTNDTNDTNEEKKFHENVHVTSELFPEKIQPTAVVVDASSGKQTNFVVKAYCDAYKKKYQHNPVMSGKTVGIIQRIAKDIGEKNAIELVAAYLEMNDEWFLKKAHDVATLEANIQKVSLYMKSGGYINSTKARQIDERSATNDAIDRAYAMTFGKKNQQTQER